MTLTFTLGIFAGALVGLLIGMEIMEEDDE